VRRNDEVTTKDNCTKFPEGNWTKCCLQHDEDYETGGTEKDRKKADKKLKNCVTKKGHMFIALIMYIGVRILGKSHFHYK